MYANLVEHFLNVAFEAIVCLFSHRCKCVRTVHEHAWQLRFSALVRPATHSNAGQWYIFEYMVLLPVLSMVKLLVWNWKFSQEGKLSVINNDEKMLESYLRVNDFFPIALYDRLHFSLRAHRVLPRLWVDAAIKQCFQIQTKLFTIFSTLENWSNSIRIANGWKLRHTNYWQTNRHKQLSAMFNCVSFIFWLHRLVC